MIDAWSTRVDLKIWSNLWKLPYSIWILMQCHRNARSEFIETIIKYPEFLHFWTEEWWKPQVVGGCTKFNRCKERSFMRHSKVPYENIYRFFELSPTTVFRAQYQWHWTAQSEALGHWLDMMRVMQPEMTRFSFGCSKAGSALQCESIHDIVPYALLSDLV